MSIIKRHKIKEKTQSESNEVTRPKTIIKASTLKQFSKSVSPDEFSNDIIFDDATEFPTLVDATPTHAPPMDEPLPDINPPTAPVATPPNSELEAHFNELLTAINNLTTSRNELIQLSQSKMLDLSLAIAEKIVHKKIELDPTVIESVIEETFNKISGSDRVTFKINPEDSAIFKDFQSSIESRLIGVEKISIVHDDHIDRGGCIIETDLGFVDITIKEKFNIIAQTLHRLKSSQ
jgi:hypothetical protein